MASLVFKRRVEGRRQKENDNRSAGAEEGMVGLGLQRGVQGGRKGHAARRIKLNCLPVVWREKNRKERMKRRKEEIREERRSTTGSYNYAN